MPTTASSVVLFSIVLASAPAWANTESVRIASGFAAADGAVNSVVLVGSSGELYLPGANLVWQRTDAGGVSSDVLGVVRDGKSLTAIANRTPLFERTGTTWSVRSLPNRGAVRLSPGGVAAISIGRQIYVRKTGAWTRRSTAPGPVTAMWAKSPTEIYASTHTGPGTAQLSVSRGNAWATIATPLAKDDAVTDIFGSRTDIVVRSRAGALLSIRGRRASPVSLSDDLANFRVQAAGSTPEGELLLVGLAGKSELQGAVLASAKGGKLSLVERLAPLQEGDAYVFVYGGARGSLLLVTRNGSVHLRDSSGTWNQGRVSPALAGTGRKFPQARPAHTQ